ncbi:MAG TPA: hypothetical protein VGM88_30660 [Kofleriaceae bacterium]|jgi:hypothetical protein
MATKKTITKKAVATPVKKAVVAPKAKKPKVTISTKERHPKGKLAAKHGSKADLAKSLAPLLAHGDQDAGALEKRLSHASNAQLLRLQRATQTLSSKYGSRDKLIATIGESHKKSGDKDFLAKLGTYSLPQLLDLAR